jgi:hypothetical protein
MLNFRFGRPLFTRSDASKLVAWLSILFLGLGYPIGLFQLFDRRPQIIINEVGIFDRTAHESFINWEIIQNAYLVEIKGQRFICLVVGPQFEPSRSKGKFAKSISKQSKVVGGQELNIYLGSVKVNAERLTDLILSMRSADKPNRSQLIKKVLPATAI